MHNNTFTNAANLILTALFFSPEIRLASNLAESTSPSERDRLTKNYITRQTFGLSQGTIQVNAGLSEKGHGPRVAAIALNEGKKYALRKFPVR